VNGDTQISPETIPLRGRRRATGRFPGARVLLVVLLAMTIAASTCPWPVNAMQPGPRGAPTAASTRYEGFLWAVSPGSWQVGQFSILLDDTTSLIQKRGKAEIGAWLIVWGQQNDAGQIRAELIQVDRPANLPGPITQLSGVLRKKTDTWWVVEQTFIEISPDTVIRGTPEIGVLVWVLVTQQGDTWRAVAAEVLTPNPANPLVEFEGPITSLLPDLWLIDNREVVIEQRTEIIGDPKIDKIAEVQAELQADGRLLARRIRIVDPSTEASLSAMVADIVRDTNDAERWEVIVFPKSPWAEPTLATLHVGLNTYVDESRTTAQTGVWADMRGAPLGAQEYQADVIRLERPVPVSITGEILAPPTTPAASSWRQINGQPVWLGPFEPGTASAQAALRGSVSVTGVRLGNGAIWAKQVLRAEP
jgi:hypothetical protein